MRKIWAFWALVAAQCAVPAWADSITVEHTSVNVQGINAFGITNAQLPNATFPAPIVITTLGVDTGARLNSIQVCLAGDPACPTTGVSPVSGSADIRFTNVDLVCPAGPSNCTNFGLGFTFSGHLNGTFVFDFLLTDLAVTLPADTFIAGNMSLELNVGGVHTSHFLPFDTRSGLSFGPVPSITVSGSDVAYSAFGTLILTGMPADSELQILHSGEFRFASAVPEPSMAIPLAVAGLLGFWRVRWQRFSSTGDQRSRPAPSA